MVENFKYNEVKCKRSLLEVSGYLIWVLQATEGFSGPFPHVREDDLLSSPEPDLRFSIKP